MWYVVEIVQAATVAATGALIAVIPAAPKSAKVAAKSVRERALHYVGTGVRSIAMGPCRSHAAVSVVAELLINAYPRLNPGLAWRETPHQTLYEVICARRMLP